jgi:cytochrome c553
MLKVVRNGVLLGLLTLVIEPLAHLSAAVPAVPVVPTMAMNSQGITRGEYLAHAADCVACHTVPGCAA